MNGFSVCLLGLLFAINSRTNIAAWLKAETMPELAMGYSSVGILWVCRVSWLLFAIVRVIRGKLDCLPPSAMGRSQTLCVLVTGMGAQFVFDAARSAPANSVDVFVAIGMKQQL
ncbi:MAG: hypothetical protein R3C56_02175 [Pirellulaceae bacterium]